ncbi:MAG: P-type conjugative transfer protein TrbG [Campylobacterales bacterium]|nr:P-type conjugative transfer protein TrbG [Campylobacterales bacterium]
MKNKILTSTLLAVMLTSGASAYSNMENHSLQLAKKFINGKDKSFYRPDGGVVFLHGGTLPSVLTAPLKLTDIELEPGETIKEVQLGDTVRWQVSPSISGSGNMQVSHVIVKPTDSGLATTLNIFTDRRSYHINLRSTSKNYFPIVAFAYQDQLRNFWSDYQKKLQQQKDNNTIKDPDIGSKNAEDLDFNYDISGSTSWKPTRVYNDGVKTYIFMPRSMNSKDAPVLLAIDGSGGQKIVNYRIVNNKFIVDNLFDKAILLIGVGSNQDKVVITHSSRSYHNRGSNLSVLEK